MRGLYHRVTEVQNTGGGHNIYTRDQNRHNESDPQQHTRIDGLCGIRIYGRRELIRLCAEDILTAVKLFLTGEYAFADECFLIIRIAVKNTVEQLLGIMPSAE